MTQMLEPIVNELRAETATTKRVLDRIPADKLTWKPHPKSMSLGELAMHVATIPGGIAAILQPDEFEFNPADLVPSKAESVQQIHAAMDESARSAEAYLTGLSDQKAVASWRMVSGGREIMKMPRVGVVRAIMLNHWYHHRGQLSVYLRLLNVPVPSIYGPSADENPFG